MFAIETLGIDLYNPYFQVWFGVLPICYILLAVLFRQCGYWSHPTKKGSRTSDVVVFELVSVICVTYIATCGLIGWFELLPSMDVKPQTFFSKATFIENHLIYPMMLYQIWNLVLCFILNELKVTTMYIHHTIVIVSCQGFLKYKIMQYYTLYMYGVLEVTNVFLSVMDTFKLVPTLPMQFPWSYQAIRFLFIVSFICIRLVFLPYYMYFMLYDCWYLIKHPEEKSVEISQEYLVFVMVAAVGMLGLQYVWGWYICQSTWKFLSKSKHSSGNNEKRKKND